MSNIAYTGLDESKDCLFPAMDSSVQQQSVNNAVYKDNDTGDQWIVEGFGLIYDQAGTLTGGTITGMEYADKKGNSFVTYSDFAYAVPADKPLFEIQNLVTLYATQDADDLKGSKQDDYLNGYQGNDFIFGNKGADDLRGEDGDDILKGGGGKDFLWAGRGNDWVTGGGGKDAFQFLYGEGQDVITDFNVRKDVFYADWEGIEAIYQAGNDTVISWGEGDQLTLIGVDADQIHEGLFI
jgi:Ca2+-binding RTX toxin-like protein